ncbi:MAG: tetratricopeptide repeat protein [Leptospiraceae bacterium]|nr:tetratricopeptide repeat protein [Leptospiraceae bacterium]
MPPQSDYSEKLSQRNALFEKALQYEKEHKWKDALKAYREALKLDTNFFEAWLNAGAIYSRQGKIQKAIDCYRQALRCRQDKKALYNLASEFFKLSQYEESQQMLERAISLDKDFLQAYILLAYVYEKLRQSQKAEAAIKEALRLDPENYSAQLALVLLYLELDKKNLAAQYLEKLLQKKPKDSYLLRLKAKLLLQENDLPQAIGLLQEIASADKRVNDIAKDLSHLQDIMRDKKQKILDKKKLNKRDLFDLSMLEFFSGNPQRALEILSKGLREG